MQAGKWRIILDIERMLIVEEKKLEEQIRKMEDFIQQHSDVSRNVRLKCGKTHNSTQYFIDGKYVSKKEIDKIKNIAQVDYCLKVKDFLSAKLKLIEKYLSRYCEAELDKSYQNLCYGRRQSVTPIQQPLDEFVEEWMTVRYEASERWEDGKPYFTTIKGEKVRSKSEKIISDELAAHNIPYRYEYPIELTVGKQQRIFRPDFMVLNKRTRQVYLLEHLGMMDKTNYYNSSLNKLSIYEQNGYLLGKNLLILHETSEAPINVSVLRNYIDEYFE